MLLSKAGQRSLTSVTLRSGSLLDRNRLSLKPYVTLTANFSSYRTLRKSTTSSNQSLSNIINGKLPQLPVPALQDTLVKFLRSAKPLLNDSEFEKTLNTVKAFGADNGVGPKLQKLLEHRASTSENWLSDWWLGSAYLEYRDPVTVYSSPGLVFPPERFESSDDQLRYAARLAYGALQFKTLIDDQAIPQDRIGNSPLDMSQYNMLFGTNRTPGKVRDQLKYSPRSGHFVIVHKNRFFKVEGFSASNQVLEPCELLKRIKYVVETSRDLGSALPVGILTSENRDTWARVYEPLSQDPANAASLRVIEDALFTVSIDSPNTPGQNDSTTCNSAVEDAALSQRQTIASRQMIHGNKTNSGNRWFDKTLQFVVGSAGECGLTYEHSPAEGPPIVSLMDSIVQNKAAHEELLKDFKDGHPPQLPEQLSFNLDNFRADIDEATRNLEKLVDNLEMSCFTFNAYGKNGIKGFKFSPDSYIQMAIQSAFHRIHGIPGAHYESASTRIYVGGRTETIRSCSLESLEFCEALNNTKVSLSEKLERLSKAIASHKNYAEQAVRGHGVDRHLLGLKLVALQNGMVIPELFTDAGYKKSTHFRLSTSQVHSKYAGAFMCYGPLVPDGYGCCYNPTSNEITFGVSAFNACQETSAGAFKGSLQEVLLDMQQVSTLKANEQKG